MKWLNYSNKVSSTALFVTAICLWYVPFSEADELVYWYAYHESKRVSKRDNLIRRYRKFLPKLFIRVYLESKLEFRKWAIENMKDELEQRRIVDDWKANNA
ncbi:MULTISPECIES: hypothetical protein [Pseudoalteromonas]|uniref:hypothetical protein n=1 Tax=Pseudoalteromonas TaxID=53246 RepID=UPI00158420C9|nr:MULTISPECIES: hypothetical protein [Pseudoalteromonas]MDI4654493.1 hypothetical protein [Pseudoalteromonas shioyasakiensis]NUJ39406.1 hypothetical protein [Pseudoalteromonas sp. 0303]